MTTSTSACRRLGAATDRSVVLEFDCLIISKTHVARYWCLDLHTSGGLKGLCLPSFNNKSCRANVSWAFPAQAVNLRFMDSLSAWELVLSSQRPEMPYISTAYRAAMADRAVSKPWGESHAPKVIDLCRARHSMHEMFYLTS